jgi:nucleoside phosphorylase
MPLADFAFVCGLVEELKTLRLLLPDLTDDPSSSNAEVWYRATVQAGSGDRYAIVATFQMKGLLDAVLITEKLINRWHPRFIIVFGIAGSFDKDVRLGDIVISQQILHYDPGKAVKEGIQYRPQGYPCSVTLIRQSEALSLDAPTFSQWQHQANLSARDKLKSTPKQAKLVDRQALSNHHPKVHFGTVSSGSLELVSKI